jgi:predicted metal-binding membrane protein
LSAVAVIFVVPALLPTATPLLSIVATVGALLDQENDAPTALPSLSTALAVYVCFPLMLTELTLGITSTLLTSWVEELPPPQETSTNAIVQRATQQKIRTKVRLVDMGIC